MEPLSENSREILKETVLHLVALNQQFDKLTKEISDKSDQDSVDYGPVSELCCLSLLKSQSLQLGANTGYHGTDQCTAVLSSIVKNCQEPLVSQTQKGEVESVVTTLQRLMSEGCLEKARFLTALLQHSILPLELLCLLAREGIISIGAYLAKKCSNSGFVAGFSLQIKLLICEDNNSDTAAYCLAGILTELLDVVYTDRKAKSSSSTVTAVNSILDRAVLDFIDLILDKPETMTMAFVKAFEKLEVAMETIKKAGSHFLSLILSHKPITKVSQAILLQGGWCYSKAPVLMISWYKQLLLTLSTTEVLEKLQRILEQQEVNWQLLLTFVSTMIVCLTDAQKIFLDFTDSLLQGGLENCDMESVITGLLLVRQACFHGPHVFMSYADWFQRTFSEGSRSLANNRKSFTFLMKFLTDIMPYETPSHLKVHILRPPFVPPKCRDQLADYILLAKTRLEDLQESLEIPGQDDSKGLDESKHKEQLQTEVENAVSVFDTTGKIPSSIMEASIFKKPYFIGRFLPALLKPRPLPAVPDAQMKLIEALKKAEKIPPTMYTTYEKACRKETLQLTEGLFLDVDSDDDMELSPLEQLENSLNQMQVVVQYLCGNIEEVPKFNVKEAVSNICEKIEVLLNVTPDQLGTGEHCVVLDMENLGIPKDSLKVVDVVLNFICQTIHATYSFLNVDFTWLCILLKGISQYSLLLKDLFKRIWSLIFSQAQTLENHHIDSLAAILVELQRLGNQVSWIEISEKCSQCLATRTFTEHVYELISVSDGKKMAFALRLTASYMKYLISSQDETNISALVPSAVVKELMYTATRLLPEARYLGLNMNTYNDNQSDQFILSLVGSPLFQGLFRNFKFTFADFLNYETTVDTENDVFTDMERYEYYSWAVYQYFLRLSVEEGGFSRDFRLAASQVLQVIVNWYCSKCKDHQPMCQKCKDQQPMCQKCKNNPPVKSACKSHMINLLQELTRMFEDISDSGGANKLPWLPRQLVSLCETSSSDLQKQATVTAFFRVALCLPAHLMFSDRHSRELLSLKEIAEFFNSFWVEYLTEGVYLPLSCTLYIAQGLKLATSEEIFCKCLDSLCRNCPVIALSVLVHYDYLENLLCSQKTVPAVLKAMEFVRHGTPLSSDVKSEDWFLAAVLFSQALRNNFEEVSQSLLCLETDKALTFLTDLLLLHWTSLQLYASHQASTTERIQNFLVELFDCERAIAIFSFLLEEKDNGGLPAQCVRKAVIQFRHIALMRLLKQLPPKTFAQRYCYSLCDLLMLFAEVAQTFERLSPDTNELPGLQQHPSLDEVMQYNRYVKEVVTAVPVRALKTVPQDLFLACGSDVVLLVQRLLSRS